MKRIQLPQENGIRVDIASFLHNTDAKMCLPDQESNNVGVDFNKYVKD